MAKIKGQDILEEFGINDEPNLSTKEIANILYAEGANDPEGWSALLNTYNKARREGESLEDAMKRKSSAYQTKSLQYKKAQSGDLNDYEKNVYNQIRQKASSFQPDPNWEYEFHENLDIYENRDAALGHLKKAWGRDVDFESETKFGRQTYFKGGKKIPQSLSKPLFDPEGSDYDYESAQKAGLKPDETGHWPSREPKTGLILKGKGHDTWGLTEEGETSLAFFLASEAKACTAMTISPVLSIRPAVVMRATAFPLFLPRRMLRIFPSRMR